MIPGSLRAGAMMARPVPRQLRIRSLPRPHVKDDPEKNLRDAHPSVIYALLSAYEPFLR